MISIDSQALNDFLYAWLQNRVPDQAIWLGGRINDGDGEWRWKDGESWSYTNWGPSEPNGDGDCAHINWNGGQGQWGDTACNYEHGYFCSMTPQTSSPSASSTSTVTADDCPSNGNWPYTWKVYGDMCYSLGTTPMEWIYAKEQCDTGVKYHSCRQVHVNTRVPFISVPI